MKKLVKVIGVTVLALAVGTIIGNVLGRLNIDTGVIGAMIACGCAAIGCSGRKKAEC